MPWVDATIHNIYNVIFRAQSPSPAFPATIWLGLATDATVPNPSNPATFTELTTGQLNGYTRQSLTMSVPGSRSVNNTVACNFTPTPAVGTGARVTHGGVFSAQTGGILLAYGLLATPLTIGTGSLVNIPIGSFTITDAVS